MAVCPRCWRDPPDFSSVTSVFRFEGTVRQAIHRLKYQGARHLAAPLVDVFLDQLEAVPCGDILVPVPLHPSRQRSRGYNQAGLLAERFAARVALPIDQTSLTRVRDTPAQVAVPPADRLANVRGAFVASGHSLAGQRVLIVDDVATSASTLRAAATALTESGARSVVALVIARAGTDDPRLGLRGAGF